MLPKGDAKMSDIKENALKPQSDKKALIAQKVLLAVYSLVAAAFVITYLLVFALGYLIFSLFFAVMAVFSAVRIATKKLPKDTLKFMTVSVLLVVAVVLLVVMTPSPIYNGFESQYELQMKYIRSYNSLTCLEFFPDKLYDSAEEYDIIFLPSVLQGSGCLSVNMKLSGQDIEKVRDEYSQLAFVSFTLHDYFNADYSEQTERELLTAYLKEKGYWESYQKYGSDGYMPQPNPTFGDNYDIERVDIEWSEITEHTNISLYVHKDIWDTDSMKDCEIYLIRLGYDHAHSSCVIIDNSAGLVSFSQLG